MGVVSPGFSWDHLTKGGWSGQDVFSSAAVPGMFAAIPFAIWFFLAIEGVAMAAEEAKNPRRSIPIAYIAGILTLVVLAAGVMLFAGAAGDWTKLPEQASWERLQPRCRDGKAPSRLKPLPHVLSLTPSLIQTSWTP